MVGNISITDVYMSVLSSLSVDEKLAVDCKTDKFYQKYVYKGTGY